MSIRLLKPVTKASHRVLEQLVAGLDVGDSKKFDNGGRFMAAHVEALQRTGAGVFYSVAHYFEANGDLVCDPDVVFLRRADGSFCPISFQNSIALRQPVRWLDDGTIEVDAREQADIASFANLLLRNISEQQGTVPVTPPGDRRSMNMPGGHGMPAPRSLVYVDLVNRSNRLRRLLELSRGLSGRSIRCATSAPRRRRADHHGPAASPQLPLDHHVDEVGRVPIGSPAARAHVVGLLLEEVDEVALDPVRVGDRGRLVDHDQLVVDVAVVGSTRPCVRVVRAPDLETADLPRVRAHAPPERFVHLGWMARHLVPANLHDDLRTSEITETTPSRRGRPSADSAWAPWDIAPHPVPRGRRGPLVKEAPAGTRTGRHRYRLTWSNGPRRPARRLASTLLQHGEDHRSARRAHDGDVVGFGVVGLGGESDALAGYGSQRPQRVGFLVPLAMFVWAAWKALPEDAKNDIYHWAKDAITGVGRQASVSDDDGNAPNAGPVRLRLRIAKHAQGHLVIAGHMPNIDGGAGHHVTHAGRADHHKHPDMKSHINQFVRKSHDFLVTRRS